MLEDQAILFEVIWLCRTDQEITPLATVIHLLWLVQKRFITCDVTCGLTVCESLPRLKVLQLIQT